ncbi:DUF378 domain-containing protein [Candidatus Nomurabacteria bacterium]|nr:DUF378 domain-containing protein [Candidatus Nomurabacteria bacterium]
MGMKIMWILVIIGALNWLLVGIFNWDFVAWLLPNILTHIVYIAVGLSGLVLLFGCPCKKCKGKKCDDGACDAGKCCDDGTCASCKMDTAKEKITDLKEDMKEKIEDTKEKVKDMVDGDDQE